MNTFYLADARSVGPSPSSRWWDTYRVGEAVHAVWAVGLQLLEVTHGPEGSHCTCTSGACRHVARLALAAELEPERFLVETPARPQPIHLRTSLAEVAGALDAGEGGRALQAGLRAWALNRSAALRELVLGLARSHEARVEGGLGLQLRAIEGLRVGQRSEALAALGTSPDPRFADFALDAIERVEGPRGEPTWWSLLFEHLVDSGDETTLPRLEALYRRSQGPYGVSTKLRSQLIRERLVAVRRLRRRLSGVSLVEPDEVAPLQRAAEAALPRRLGQETELLAAIAATPEDDAPRAVLADLLAAEGDPRGEFIALQLAGGDTQPRQQALLREHWQTWLDPIARVLDYEGLRFERGFLHRARVDERWWSRAWGGLESEALWRTAYALWGPPKLVLRGDLPLLREVCLESEAIGALARGGEARPFTHVSALGAAPELERLSLCPLPRLETLRLIYQGPEPWLVPAMVPRLLGALELRFADLAAVEVVSHPTESSAWLEALAEAELERVALHEGWEGDGPAGWSLHFEGSGFEQLRIAHHGEEVTSRQALVDRLPPVSAVVLEEVPGLDALYECLRRRFPHADLAGPKWS